MGLATPAAIAVGLGRAAEKRQFCSGRRDSLELLKKLSRLFLTKPEHLLQVVIQYPGI